MPLAFTQEDFLFIMLDSNIQAWHTLSRTGHNNKNKEGLFNWSEKVANTIVIMDLHTFSKVKILNSWEIFLECLISNKK